MIDVVDLAVGGLEVEEVAHRLDDVARVEYGEVERVVEVELVVQLETANAAEVVTLGLVEEVLEEGLRGLRGGRVARAQPLEDFDAGLFRAGDLVDGEGVAKERSNLDAVDEEDTDLRATPCAQDRKLGRGQLLVALEDDFAGLFVIDIFGGVFCVEFVVANRHALETELLHLTKLGLGDLLLGADQEGTGLLGVLDVNRRHGVGVKIDIDDLLRAAVEVDLLGAVEETKDLFRRQTSAVGLGVLAIRVRGRLVERAQEYGCRQLPAAIDANVEDVLGVELEVDPGAPVGDDPGRVEEFARGVLLAAVVIEEGAGRAVKLADDNTLGAVDDEGTVVGHQRDFAEVDLLFLHVADGANACVLIEIPDDEPDADLDRRSIVHAARDALVDIILGLLEPVLDELKRAVLVVVLDGEDGLEDSLEADIFALRLGIGLQELLVGALLDVDKVGNLHMPVEACEGFADPEVGLNDRGHPVHLRDRGLNPLIKCKQMPRSIARDQRRYEVAWGPRERTEGGGNSLSDD